MSLKHINSKLQSERGFTIVELLIVIVVIGILAAITIVAYNGVTNRANAASAQAAAANVVKKAEAHNAEVGRYPITTAELTGAATTTTYNIPTGSVTFTASPADITAAPSPINTVRFLKCAASGATQASITASNITGVRVSYWDFGATPAVMRSIDAGVTTACPTAV